MRGYFKLLNFLIFLVQITPSPTTDVVPPLPMSESFQCIDFIYKFYLFGEKQPACSAINPSLNPRGPPSTPELRSVESSDLS